MKVVDVGAAPGGWTQIIGERIESKQKTEKLVAIDLLSMNPMEGVTIL